LIWGNRRTTYVELERERGIGSAALQTFIHDHLSLQNRCSRWVLHKLTDDQKDRRLNWCRFMIEKFDGDKKKKCIRYTYLPVTKHGCIIMIPKQNDNRLYGALKMNKRRQNVAVPTETNDRLVFL